MGIILIRAINWFAQLIIFALCARAILSWVGQNPYSSLGKAYQAMVKLTEPIVAPCRKILSRFNTGMFDFSVLLAFFLVEIIARLLVFLVRIIFYIM